MEISKALQVINSLIEQAMAAGMFKDFRTLDTARTAYTSILEHLKNLNDGKSKQGSGEESSAKESS